MRFEGDDRLPRGQVALAARCGTRARLARTGWVRFAAFLRLLAAACGGRDAPAAAARPRRRRSRRRATRRRRGSSDAGDAAGSTLVDGSPGSVTAAFESCGASPATGSFPADVAAILTDKCQTCHTDPPKNGAPFPLLTYEDVHKPFAGTDPDLPGDVHPHSAGRDPRTCRSAMPRSSRRTSSHAERLADLLRSARELSGDRSAKVTLRSRGPSRSRHRDVSDRVTRAERFPRDSNGLRDSRRHGRRRAAAEGLRRDRRCGRAGVPQPARGAGRRSRSHRSPWR